MSADTGDSAVQATGGEGPAPQASADGPVVVVLEEGVSIATVADLHARLRALTQAGDVQIDASHIEAPDTAVLQLLGAFVRERSAQGRRTRWQGVSEALFRMAELLDLSRTLGLDEDRDTGPPPDPVSP